MTRDSGWYDPFQPEVFVVGFDRVLMEPLEPRILFSAAPAPTPADVVAQANNAFAFDLLQQLTPDSSGNLFFSPYSAATALEMALQGANGVTASEMIQALHLPSDQIAQAGIEALYQLFQAAPATAGYTLSTANRLWVSDNFPLLNSFLTNSQNTFGAAPQSVDFSDPAAAANTINTWVSNQTNGKITNLIPASDLNSYTALVITNAIYFKGSWADPFYAYATQSSPFQISSTEAATVEMMQQTTYLDYYAQSGPEGFQAVDLPYAGNNLDMLVILPTSYDIGSFQSGLTPDVFSQIVSDLSPTNVDVSLPQFELSEAYDLVQPLKNLGIHAAFSPGADFTGIAPSLYISDVVQKSYIKVDETGTEAAAATGIVVQICCVAAFPPPAISFDADHPFLFAIRDRSTNTILFLGRVDDPSNGTADYATPPTTLSYSVTPTDPNSIGINFNSVKKAPTNPILEQSSPVIIVSPNWSHSLSAVNTNSIFLDSPADSSVSASDLALLQNNVATVLD